MKALTLLCLFSIAALPKDLLFEANQGQAPSQVQFVARTSSYTLLLKGSNTELVFKDSPRVKLDFLRSNQAPALTASEPSPATINYFSGPDERTWKRDIPTYKKVQYSSVYPGIDMVFYGSGNLLEYDFIVNAGADPARIALGFDSSVKPFVATNGDLVLPVQSGELRFHSPVLYQPQSKAVSGKYMLHSDGTVSFDIGRYDHTQTLTIDPVVTYSSYLGGTDDEGIFGIKRDKQGNLYLSGETSSLNFPIEHAFQSTEGGDYDAFVSKFDPTGTHLIYSTYLGGTAYDHAVGLAVDASGSAYLAGLTMSPNFPTKHALQSVLKGEQNAFVARLTPSGSDLVFSSYLGGSQYDVAQDITIDENSNIYIAGTTNSPDFPVTSGAFQTMCGGPGGSGPSFCSNDAFITKLPSNGSKLIYSTFLGGSTYDSASGIAIDATGAVYITGQTSSSDFPLEKPYQSKLAGLENAFVSKLNPAGSKLEFSTYLGGSGFDGGNAILVTLQGDVYVTGLTSSTNFPLVKPFQSANGGGFTDCFIAKFSSDGTNLLRSSYFGGNGLDYPFRLAVDVFGSVSVIGFTASTNLPTVDALQPSYAGGNTDAFILKLLPESFKPLYATYYGGTGDEFGYAIYSEDLGGVWVGGSTSSTNYPVKRAFQSEYGGGPYDAFLTHVDLTAKDYLRLLEDLLSGGNASPEQIAVVKGALAAAQENRDALK